MKQTMFPIKDVAQQLDIKVQSVEYHMKKLNASYKYVDNKRYIDNDTINLIKERMNIPIDDVTDSSTEQQTITTDKEKTINQDIVNPIALLQSHIESLEQHIKLLKEQLSNQDKDQQNHIESLNNHNKTLENELKVKDKQIETLSKLLENEQSLRLEAIQGSNKNIESSNIVGNKDSTDGQNINEDIKRAKDIQGSDNTYKDAHKVSNKQRGFFGRLFGK